MSRRYSIPEDLARTSFRSRSAGPVIRVLSRPCYCLDNHSLTTFVFSRIECSIVAGTTRMIRE